MSKEKNKIVIASKEKGKGMVKLELIPDPDGSCLPWFENTGEPVDLEGKTLLSEDKLQYEGRCTDVGEYFSPAGLKVKELLQKAPKDTSIMVFSFEESCGTRTYKGRISVQYYL